MPYCTECGSTFALPPGRQVHACPVCGADLRPQRAQLDPAPPAAEGTQAAAMAAAGGLCPECGAELVPDDEVCIQCGTHLATLSAAPAPVAQVPAPGPAAAPAAPAPGPAPLAAVPAQPTAAELDARLEIALRLGDATKWLMILSILVPPLFPLAVILGAIAASAGSYEAARWVHRGVIVGAIVLAVATVVGGVTLVVLHLRILPGVFPPVP